MFPQYDSLARASREQRESARRHGARGSLQIIRSARRAARSER